MRNTIDILFKVCSYLCYSYLLAQLVLQTIVMEGENLDKLTYYLISFI